MTPSCTINDSYLISHPTHVPHVLPHQLRAVMAHRVLMRQYHWISDVHCTEVRALISYVFTLYLRHS